MDERIVNDIGIEVKNLLHTANAKIKMLENTMDDLDNCTNDTKEEQIREYISGFLDYDAFKTIPVNTSTNSKISRKRNSSFTDLYGEKINFKDKILIKKYLDGYTDSMILDSIKSILNGLKMNNEMKKVLEENK